jgi:excisionase family DNA binding protein
MISVTSASERLGVTRGVIMNAIEKGVIEAVKVGALWQVNEDSLKNYKRTQRRRAER